MDSGGGAAVLGRRPMRRRRPAFEEPPMANDDDIARLNKMFGMGDGSVKSARGVASGTRLRRGGDQ